ncbi:hypothetical protein Droror1_Dr00004289 [Drosera rotundifolia]
MGSKAEIAGSGGEERGRQRETPFCSNNLPLQSPRITLANNITSNKWSLQGVIGKERAIVEELVGLGANVHTCGRDEGLLGNCLEEWKTEGGRVSGSVCDVSDRGQREELMEDARLCSMASSICV